LLNSAETTTLTKRAIVANDLVAVAELLDLAEQHLHATDITSNTGWYNLSIIAQVARSTNSPVLSLARQAAIQNADKAESDYCRILRDMVLVESGDPIELIEEHIESTDRVGYYVAKRASHLAAEQNNPRILRKCLTRLSSFDNVDGLNGSPHINWLIAKALLDKVMGKPVDRDELCAKIRSTPYLWKCYCREISSVLGSHDSDTCAACVAKMAGIPQLGE